MIDGEEIAEGTCLEESKEDARLKESQEGAWREKNEEGTRSQGSEARFAPPGPPNIATTGMPPWHNSEMDRRSLGMCVRHLR
jgi:hypothetical protein